MDRGAKASEKTAELIGVVKSSTLVATFSN
jgi:hypothetical protein